MVGLYQNIQTLGCASWTIRSQKTRTQSLIVKSIVFLCNVQFHTLFVLLTSSFVISTSGTSLTSGNQEDEVVLVIKCSLSLHAFCHRVFYKLFIQCRVKFNQPTKPVEDVMRVLQVERAKTFIRIVKKREIASFLFLFRNSRDSCKTRNNHMR